MSNEAPDQTLQPTALVHEAWLHLAGEDNPKFQGRAHFFGGAAEGMRRILIENARRKRGQRHGGGQQCVILKKRKLLPLRTMMNCLPLDEALGKHESTPNWVKLRFFVGMTIEEAAEAVDISKPTADRYWAYAKAWLHNEIQKRSS